MLDEPLNNRVYYFFFFSFLKQCNNWCIKWVLAEHALVRFIVQSVFSVSSTQIDTGHVLISFAKRLDAGGNC